jgi:hypothetical protein
LLVDAVCAACDAHAAPPADPDHGKSCELASTHATTCDPPTLGDLSVAVEGLPWTESAEVYIGVADCVIEASKKMGSTSTIELACEHVDGDWIEPSVTITVESAAVHLTPTLHPARAVRLHAAEFLSDEDVPSAYWYTLERLDDGALLFAWTNGAGHVVPWIPLLAEIGLAPADWLAPLSAQLVGGVCPQQPAFCSGVWERGAIALEVAGHDPARILDHSSGTVDGGYEVFVGSAESYSDPLSCVDDQPRCDFLVVARPQCPN